MQVVRKIFFLRSANCAAPRALLATEDLGHAVAIHASDMPDMRLILRAGGLLVMLPEFVRHLTLGRLYVLPIAGVQEHVFQNLAASFWPVCMRPERVALVEALKIVIDMYVRLFWTVRAGIYAFRPFWSR